MSKSSVNNNNGPDCLECRLTGSVALFSISGFVFAQRKHQTSRFGKGSVSLIAVSVAALAVARAFNLPPFSKQKI